MSKNTKKLPTLAIALPAFNEEKNISNILNDIQKQKIVTAKLKTVLVVSDGSTDRTDALVQKMERNHSIIHLISIAKRKGQANALNTIIKKTNEEILVILNADIRLKQNHLIEALIKPIVEKKAELTTPALEVLPPHNFIERILFLSLEFKHLAYESYRNGKTIYTCNGRARGLSKNFYKKLDFKHSVGEDAYSYLNCISHNYRYLHLPNIKVTYRLPSTLADHIKQSKRFYQSQHVFDAEFGTKMIEEQYNIVPKTRIFLTMIKFVFSHPLILAYYALAVGIKVLAFFQPQQSTQLWTISETSKRLE